MKKRKNDFAVVRSARRSAGHARQRGLVADAAEHRMAIVNARINHGEVHALSFKTVERDGARIFRVSRNRLGDEFLVAAVHRKPAVAQQSLRSQAVINRVFEHKPFGFEFADRSDFGLLRQRF